MVNQVLLRVKQHIYTQYTIIQHKHKHKQNFNFHFRLFSDHITAFLQKPNCTFDLDYFFKTLKRKNDSKTSNNLKLIIY